MTCGESWLPIVSENVSEIDVSLTYVSWFFNKITRILFFVYCPSIFNLKQSHLGIHIKVECQVCRIGGW